MSLHDALCDICDARIIGTRWKCTNCVDYDLCHTCFLNNKQNYDLLPNGHNFRTHVFIKLNYKLKQSIKHVLYFREPIFENTTDTLVHKGIICDGCECVISNQYRFCCINCDFDYCETCERKSTHDPTHAFLFCKVRVPAYWLPSMHTTVYEACPEIYIKQEINIQPVIAPVPYQHSQFFDWGMLMKMDYLHVEEVVDIELDCFPESPYEEVLFNKYISKQLDFHHSGSIRGCFINYVAMDHDERVIGYSITRVMLKCSNLGAKFLEGHIYSIAVSPQHRRMKIGDTLLQHSIGNVKWLQGLLSIPEACITLNVNVNNIGAQRLYSRTGFKTQMWNEKYYQDLSEDALFMKLDL